MLNAHSRLFLCFGRDYCLIYKVFVQHVRHDLRSAVAYTEVPRVFHVITFKFQANLLWTTWTPGEWSPAPRHPGSPGSLSYLLSRRLLTIWTSWRMASSSLAPDSPGSLFYLLSSRLLTTWTSWVSILPAEQQTLDHLDLLANDFQLFDTLAPLGLYLTCRAADS